MSDCLADIAGAVGTGVCRSSGGCCLPAPTHSYSLLPTPARFCPFLPTPAHFCPLLPVSAHSCPPCLLPLPNAGAQGLRWVLGRFAPIPAGSQGVLLPSGVAKAGPQSFSLWPRGKGWHWPWSCCWPQALTGERLRCGASASGVTVAGDDGGSQWPSGR